ncbi:MAG: cyclopropane-fatty-acyl-phospholipid synthase family protein [Planctomycetales bacterium]
MDPVAREHVASPLPRTQSAPHQSNGSTTHAPPSLPISRQEPVSSFERWVLRRVLAALGDPPVTFALWNGEEVRPLHGEPIARLRLTDRGALRRMMFDPWFQAGEAYADGQLEFDGPLDEFFATVWGALGRRAGRKLPGGLLARLLHRPRRTGLGQAKENIHHHYDIGNDFYRLWLDEEMVYTCAYFAEDTFSLEQAQMAKLDHVCRKVWLRPGDRVIEAGCGWGALSLHMARKYGATVRAFNISREQVEFARDRARREGLADRVEFVLDDWRNIAGECDALVSVGMLEHVGRENYRELGDVLDRVLAPAGRGLIHSITRSRPKPLDPWIERRIFPGAYPPALSELVDIFEPHRFAILDMENLRLHYAETLRHWLERFEQSADAVRAMFDERFVRTWRLYLAGSIAAFVSGELQLHQMTFARDGEDALPRTRAGLYGDGDAFWVNHERHEKHEK